MYGKCISNKRSAFCYFSIIVLSVTVCMGLMGHTKDLTHRLGVGYKNQFTYDLPSLAAQYYPNPELGLSAALGFDTQKEASKFGLLIRVYKIIFKGFLKVLS